MRRLISVLLIVGFSLLGLAVVAQEQSEQVNIAFIFDASGSMLAGMEGRTRLDVAQDAMAGLVADLPAGTNASLWVYGHRLPQDNPAASCQDIEEVIALAPVDAAQFEATVRQLNAIGYTPITNSMQLAAQSLVNQTGARNTIVLVSDGEETCGGSPCLMAQTLKAANIELTVNTIGFAADDVTRQQLECIAEVTGGSYYDAGDSTELTEALEAAVAPPGTVRLVDAGGVTQWEMAFSLQATGSTAPARDFLGTATVPAGEYRALVASEPPLDVVVTVEADGVTDIEVSLPEATAIRMANLAGDPLPDLSFVVTDDAGSEPLYGTGVLRLEPGDYHVSVNTAFSQEFDVTVLDGVTATIFVDDAEGLIRIVNLAGDPLPEMYFNAVDPVSGETVYAQGALRVPPGSYPVEVATAFATLADVVVAEGQTFDVAVDDRQGTLVLVDLPGVPLPGVSFNITDPVTGEIHYAMGEITVPPGTYALNVPLQPPVNVEVTVEDGQRLEVPINNELGAVRLVDSAGNPLPELSFNVTDPSTGDVSYVTGETQLAPGQYAVQVNTTFPFNRTVEVQPGEVTDIPVATAAGTIRLVDGRGRGQPSVLFTIEQIDGDGQTSVTGEIDVPPGLYRVTVATSDGLEVEVEVAEDEVTTINIVNGTTNRPAP